MTKMLLAVSVETRKRQSVIAESIAPGGWSDGCQREDVLKLVITP